MGGIALAAAAMLATWLVASPVRADEPPAAPREPTEAVVDATTLEKPAPVEFGGEVLFTVRARVGG
ncbi:MAG TPA: hypothetical protein PLL32_10255, partial [Anaeromyxobacteraceae bacterium]|nr:hypothetical protein [Anaeromyxobacteraceae bacterium]